MGILVKKNYIGLYINRKEGNKRILHTLSKESSKGLDTNVNNPINEYLKHNNKEDINFSKSKDNREDKENVNFLITKRDCFKNLKSEKPDRKIIEVYSGFFKDKTGLFPKPHENDKKTATEIFQFFLSQKEGITEDEAIQSFEFILSNWGKLDSFIQNQIDLKNIRDNLNKILFQLQKSQVGNNRSVSSGALHVQEINELFYGD